MLKRLNPRQNNVSCTQTSSTRNQLTQKLFDIITIKAMKKVDIEQQLYVSHGSEYRFGNLGLTL